MNSKPNEVRDPPVSFRPGKLRNALKQRAVRVVTEGQVAKRDLARYYLLLGEALSGVHLTKNEASYLARLDFNQQLADELSGDPFIPEYENPSDYLMRIVLTPIRFAERQGKPARTLVYQVADKVEKMTPLERAALLDAIDRLPSESEEEVGHIANWQLIGMPLSDDPLIVEDVVGKEGTDGQHS